MIRHRKILRRGVPAPADVSVVPNVDHWHDTHNAPEFLIFGIHAHEQSDDAYVSEVPVELGFRGEGQPIGWQTRYDFTNIDQLCIEVQSAWEGFGLSGEYRAQYSLDDGVTWHYFDGISGPRVDVSSAIHYGTVLRGEWIAISSASRADVLLRIVSMYSDGETIKPGSLSVWGR